MPVLRKTVYASLMMALSIPYAGAAEKDTQALELLVVSGSRTEQSELTTPASISVITQAQIARSGAQHLVEVLRGQGGVFVQDLYGDGSKASVSMRGFGDSAKSNTLVLVDGRRLNNIDLSGANLNSISLKDVARIEIVQGSAGTLFGDQSVGGVINIITRAPGKRRARIEGGMGSYNAQTLRASVSERLRGGFFYRVSGERRFSDNYRDHNELTYDNLLARTGFDYGSGSVALELQRVSEDLQTPGSLNAAEVQANRRQSLLPFKEDFVNQDTDVARLSLEQALGTHWRIEVEHTDRDENSKFQVSSRYGATTTPSYIANRQRELTPRLIMAYPLFGGELQTTLGADLRKSDYRAEYFFGASSSVTTDEQTQGGVYVQTTLPLGSKLSLTAGGRKAKVENDVRAAFAKDQLDEQVTVATLGVLFRPIKPLRVFLRRDENFRFGKVEEITYTSPGVQLKTQIGVSWESGVEWDSKKLRGKLMLYRLQLEDEIAFDASATGPSGAPFPGANVNLDPTTHQGLILDGRWQLLSPWGLSGSYTYTDARFDSGVFEDKVIPDVPRHVARIATDVQFMRAWNAYVELLYTSDRYLSGDNANTAEKLPSYTVLNINSNLSIAQWTLAARINNLTDRRYSESGNVYGSLYPSPERNFALSAKYAFN